MKALEAVRTNAEFSARRLARKLEKPRTNSNVYAWQLPAIYAARNAQMTGQFAHASSLAASLRTDDALLVAYQNRLAPLRCLRVQLTPASPDSRARGIAEEADALFGQGGVALSQATISDIVGCLVNHGVAFTVNDWVTNNEGTRRVPTVRYWPIEFVRWDSYKQCYVARLDMASADEWEVPIVHGDGRWTIYAKHEHEPWKHGAVLAAALVWARHAFAGKDWAKASVAHGAAKVMGELPAGVSLQNGEGGLSPDAAAFSELLQSFASDESVVGIIPAGAKTQFVSNNSPAWQIFSELMNNSEKAAARIYLGTDGVLGAQGGAPGVDIESLFGVATTFVQGDVQAVERGVHEGVIAPWCAQNFGDSSLAPVRSYLMPDADADAAREAQAKRMQALLDELERQKAMGFQVTQQWIDDRAKAHDVPAPQLVAPQKLELRLSAAPSELPKEFRLFRQGPNDTEIGRFLFDDEAATSVMTEYERAGVELMIDLDHQSATEHIDKDPTARDARGWFRLELRNGELWAVNVHWTDDGARRVLEHRQRYISPLFAHVKGNVTRVIGAALVTMPAIHNAPPLLASTEGS